MKYFSLILVLSVTIGCERAIQKPSQDRSRLDKIALVYQEGNFDQAVTELSGYLKDYQNDALAWNILANAYAELDQLNKAQNAYESAIKIDPRCFEAITGLGVVHRKQGRNEAAMAAYQKAVEIEPTYAHAYSSMTMIAIQQYDDVKALEYAKKGYDLDSTEPVIAANLALAYFLNNDVENQIRYAGIAEKLGYKNMEALQDIFDGKSKIRE